MSEQQTFTAPPYEGSVGNMLHEMDEVSNVPNRLHDLGSSFQKKIEAHGNNYMQYGNILIAMFPNGIILNSAASFERLSLIVHIISKLSKYSQTINKIGDADSLDDIATYAQMLRQYDAEINHQNMKQETRNANRSLQENVSKLDNNGVKKSKKK